MKDQEVVVGWCDCHLHDHYVFMTLQTFEPEWPNLWCGIRFNGSTFWRRFSQGLRYIFGKSCGFLDLAEVDVDPDSVPAMIELLTKFYQKCLQSHRLDQMTLEKLAGEEQK